MGIGDVNRVRAALFVSFSAQLSVVYKEFSDKVCIDQHWNCVKPILYLKIIVHILKTKAHPKSKDLRKKKHETMNFDV